MNRDTILDKVIIATIQHALNKINDNSVYSLFKEELSDIQKRYEVTYSFEELFTFYGMHNTRLTLMGAIMAIAANAKNSGFITPEDDEFTDKVHARPNYETEWAWLMSNIYNTIMTSGIVPGITEFNKIVSILKTQKEEIHDTQQVRKIKSMSYKIICILSSLLVAVLDYLIQQYQESGDPTTITKNLDLDEVRELDLIQEGLQSKNVKALANFYISVNLINILSVLGFIIANFLAAKLVVKSQEIISDTYSILLLTIAIYISIFQDSLKNDKNVYNVVYKENRMLSRNFLNLVSVFAEICEKCKGKKFECVDEELVNDIYTDGKNYHYVSIILSSYE